MRNASAFFSADPAGAPIGSSSPASSRPAAGTRSAQGIESPYLWRAAALPASSAEHAVSSGYPTLDNELPGGGWPQGQLTELLLDAPGLGELSLLAPALAQAGRHTCVWVLPLAGDRASTAPSLPYAPALQTAGIDPAHCLFVQPATVRESWWALEQALRADHLGAVIGWLPDSTNAEGDFRALRRLHLLAAQHRALTVVLRSTRHAASPSPAALRLQLAQHDGSLHVQILKRRGRPLLEPVVLQVHPTAWRTARVAPPAATEPVEVPVSLAQQGMQSAQRAQRDQRWSLKALFSH